MGKRRRDRLRKAVEKHQDILAQAKSLMTDLVLTELKVGLQFAEFARDSFAKGLPSSGRRQQAAAVWACQAVEKFLPRCAPTTEQTTLIETQLVELKTTISKLEHRPKENG
jgi:hypothetical protein